MALKRDEMRTKYDQRIWKGVRVHRRFVFRGARQAAPENKKPEPETRGTFWRRHPAPFAKRAEGKARRDQRRFRQDQRAIHSGREYDDGWYSMIDLSLGRAA